MGDRSLNGVGTLDFPGRQRAESFPYRYQYLNTQILILPKMDQVLGGTQDYALGRYQHVSVTVREPLNENEMLLLVRMLEAALHHQQPIGRTEVPPEVTEVKTKKSDQPVLVFVTNYP